MTFSQNSNITGTVVEEGSTAKMADVIVAIEGTAFVQTTDDNGQFDFDQAIPEGEHVVTVSKEGYEVKYFLIDIIQGKKMVVDEVKMVMTKQEKKRRKKLEKSSDKGNRKAEKERESKIKEAIKDGEKQDKRLAKEEKKLKKDKKGLFGILGKKKAPEVAVVYEDIPEESEIEEEVQEEIITPLQKKYAEILEVAPEEITNTDLYTFIDEWMGTTYLWGGETKAGIDCSSFTQRLFMVVYDWYIERTAQDQMDSEATKTFAGIQFFEEGDLVFFRAHDDLSKTINHVGVYLGNNKFVSATSTRGKSGNSGVKITDLSDPYWTKRFFAGGRRVNTKG